MDALKGKQHDRPPVAVFTQSATIGQMNALGVSWPEAHYDVDKMVTLGAGQAKVFGFEAVRAPFCLTAEAESLGLTVDKGRPDRTPMLKGHPFAMEDTPALMDVATFLKTGRAAVVQKAITKMKAQYGAEYPVIAGNTGPFTLAGHLVGTENLVLYIMVDPSLVHVWVKAVNEICTGYTQALADAGADIVQMSEPSASTDLLSPDMFDEYAGTYLKTCLAPVKKATGVLHICGNTTPILNNMIATGCKALSIEEKVVPEEAVRIVNKRAALVGNIGVVNPLLQGTPADVLAHGKRCVAAGFDVVAPGCGLSALIKDENLAALVKAVKG
ncbi:MAG: MtaA/CmuA family methyltransferase [Methanomassiliicoccales archaeon]|nr:MtaA/CmuA family methyltransferase [Methanomassiliicoccales archaeon]